MKIREYIFLAVGCVSLGMVITFIVLAITQRLGLNIIEEHLWVVAIPAVLALILNIIFLELYHKYRKKKD